MLLYSRRQLHVCSDSAEELLIAAETFLACCIKALQQLHTHIWSTETPTSHLCWSTLCANEESSQRRYPAVNELRVPYDWIVAVWILTENEGNIHCIYSKSNPQCGLKGDSSRKCWIQTIYLVFLLSSETVLIWCNIYPSPAQSHMFIWQLFPHADTYHKIYFWVCFVFSLVFTKRVYYSYIIHIIKFNLYSNVYKVEFRQHLWPTIIII